MSSNNILLGYGILTALIAIGGAQDWRTGEISNWISVPLFVMGVIAVIMRVLFLNDVLTGLSIFVMAAITLAALNGWMGGADWKILIGLFGLWPPAGCVALVIAGIWGGLAMLLSGDRNAHFPGVTAFAFGACLTFLMKAYTMPLN